MSFNGSGTFNLATGNPVVTGTTISSTWANNTLSDIATGLSNCITRDGQSPATANIPMGTHKLTGLSAGTTAGDSARYEQVTSAVAITGGAIDGTPIGGTTPAAGAFTTLSASSTVTLSGGTANGVLYLNGSKVATSGSALTFDGSLFKIYNNSTYAIHSIESGASALYAPRLQLTDSRTGSATTYQLVSGAALGAFTLTDVTNSQTAYNYIGGASGYHNWYQNSLEQMRLTSTGLGIGTSSPSEKLTVAGSINLAGRGNTYSLKLPDWRFYNSSSGNALVWDNYSTEMMRLDSSGNLGLGVTSPSFLLDLSTSNGTSVRAGSSSGIVLGSYNGEGHVSSGMTLGSGGSWTARNTGAADIIINASSSGTIIFSTNAGLTIGNAFSLSERMRIDSSGNLLVGTTSANGKITSNIGAASSSAVTAVFTGGGGTGVGFRSSFENTTGTAYHCYFVYNGTPVGAITSSSTTTTYATSSDYRLKENIQPMQGALATVAQLNPVTYKWKADGSDGQGFIAHELQAVVPDCVTGEKDAVDADGKPVYQGIDTSFLVATLTAAIQEQQALIESLTARINTLEGK